MSAGYMRKCVSWGKPKQRHGTQEQAEKQRRSLVAIGRWTMSGSNTYWCNQCLHWHAGSVNVNRGRGRRKKKPPPRLDCQ